MNFLDKWNKAKFNAYDSEEKTVLKIINKISDFVGEMSKGIDQKTELNGDHKGSWQGISKPTLSDEGMRGTVEKINDVDIPLLNKNLEKNNENIKKIGGKSRQLKQKFSIPPFWGANSKKPTLPTYSDIERDIQLFVDMGFEDLQLVVHIDYSVNNGMYSSEQLNTLLYACDKAKEKGISTSMVKFHIWFDEGLFLTNTQTIISSYKGQIDKWAKAFQNKGVEYFTVLNEISSVYHNPSFEGFVIDCLNIPKLYGFKSSITTKGTEEVLRLSDTIFNTLDVICFNCYPRISNKGENTTYEDSINSWLIDKLMVEKIKSKSNGKKLLLTETGIQDKYECFFNPGDYTIGDIDYKSSNGETCLIFLYGLLNSGILDYLDYFCYWYYDYIKFDNVKEFIKNIKFEVF